MSVWTSLPRVGIDDSALLRRAAAWFGARAPDDAAWRRIAGLLGDAALPQPEWGGVFSCAASELPARLPADWVAVLAGNGLGAVVIDGRWAVAVTAAVLGTAPDELAAPRPLTPAEEGVMGYVVAAAMVAMGVQGVAVAGTTCDAGALRSALCGGRVAGAQAMARVGPVVGPIVVVVPGAVLARVAALPPTNRALGRLDGIDVPFDLVVGGTQLAPDEVATLAVGDIVTLDFALDGAALADAHGALAATVSPVGLTVTAAYAHVDLMAKHLVADALRIPLVARLGQVTLSAREVLELEPGAVIPLGRPVGTVVELTSAGHVVARGELVDIEGEVGIRLTEVTAAR